jgi:hypothetical protein
VIGTEWLGRHLRIVEVTCPNGEHNPGSILFAVPVRRPGHPRLIEVEGWQDGRIVPGYRVPSPTYERKTRTLGSLSTDRAGDCGTAMEWKSTGWFFRLTRVASKDVCDGEAFSWDNSQQWQVYPNRRESRFPADLDPIP